MREGLLRGSCMQLVGESFPAQKLESVRIQLFPYLVLGIAALSAISFPLSHLKWTFFFRPFWWNVGRPGRWPLLGEPTTRLFFRRAGHRVACQSVPLPPAAA